MYDISVDIVHPNVGSVALKHWNTYKIYESKYFISNYSINSFNQAVYFVNNFYENVNSKIVTQKIILDSGCGRGMSSIILANNNPTTPVIGVDRSYVRLSSNKKFKLQEGLIDENEYDELPKNLILLRADLVDFWMLISKQSNWKITEHYILYPNPYPKAKHLMRRWQGKS